MQLLFESFRTINRNLGMIWPPIITGIGFLLLFLIPVVMLIAGAGILMSVDPLFSGGLDSLSSGLEEFFGGLFENIGPGFFLILIPLFLLFVLVGIVVNALISAGSYKLASDVLNGHKTYWSSFFRGGFRYLGWSLVFMFVSWFMMAPVQILDALVGSLIPEDDSLLLAVLNLILTFVVQYLLLLFYPALIDGGKKFGEALGTSFRLAWKAFLATILPGIGLLIAIAIVIFAFIGIGYLTHPLVTILLVIPLVIYLSPLASVWMTLVYRKLTEPTEPAAPDTFEKF